MTVVRAVGTALTKFRKPHWMQRSRAIMTARHQDTLFATEEREGFSVREVAERFGLHRDTIYQEINEGRLEACKVRGRTVIFRDALAAWRESLPRLGHGQGNGQDQKNAEKSRAVKAV